MSQPWRVPSARVIDEQFARVGIADYFRSGHYQVRFYAAGEPTLQIDLIRRLTAFAKEIAGDRLVTEIQTNGLLDEETAQWIGANINNIWISWDGPPDVQDVYRVTETARPSSPIVEAAVRNLLDARGRSAHTGFVGVRATITDCSMHRQRELVDYFASQGINIVYGDPVFSSVSRDDNDIAVAPIDMRAYCDQFVEAYEYAMKHGVFYGSFLTINFDGPCSVHCRACLPTPHLTYDGYVSACDMALHRDCPSHMRQLIYGRWNARKNAFGIFPIRISSFQQRRPENLDPCKACSIQHYCAGGCLGEALNETKNLFGILTNTCEATRYLATRLPAGRLLLPVHHP